MKIMLDSLGSFGWYMCIPNELIQNSIFGSPYSLLCTTTFSSFLSYISLYCLVIFFRDTMFVVALLLNHMELFHPSIFDLWFTRSFPPFTCTFIFVLYLFNSLVNILLNIKYSVDLLSSIITFLVLSYG